MRVLEADTDAQALGNGPRDCLRAGLPLSSLYGTSCFSIDNLPGAFAALPHRSSAIPWRDLQTKGFKSAVRRSDGARGAGPGAGALPTTSGTRACERARPNTATFRFETLPAVTFQVLRASF